MPFTAEVLQAIAELDEPAVLATRPPKATKSSNGTTDATDDQTPEKVESEEDSK